jgi:hypothetical protein
MLTTRSDSRLEKVVVLTCDSRTLIGTLLSCDQMTNLVGSALAPQSQPGAACPWFNVPWLS